MNKTQKREIAKDIIQEALSMAYYKISDDPDNYGVTEEEAMEISEIINGICKHLCYRMGRDHYTV